MKIKETKILQAKRLNELCTEKGIEYESMNELIESVKSKKLLKRINFQHQKMNYIIEKAIK